MSDRLRYDRRFLRQLDALPGDLRAITRTQAQALTENPRPPRAKELTGHPGYFRLWLPRDCRRVYAVIDEEALVDLLNVGPKLPDLYEKLGLGQE